MSEPFIAEVKIFAGNFAPRGWAFCNGQLLPITQNTALFALVGTTYGGDGRATMGLPNLRGRAPMHPGNGPGLTSRRLGDSGGDTDVTLTVAQTAVHSHTAQLFNDLATTTGVPAAATLARSGTYKNYGPELDTVAMSNQAMSSSGGGQSHNNMQPLLGLNFIIALVGLFPSRN